MAEVWMSETLSKVQVDRQRKDIRRDAFFPDEGSENYQAKFESPDGRVLAFFPVYLDESGLTLVKIDGEFLPVETATFGAARFVSFTKPTQKRDIALGGCLYAQLPT